MRGGSVVSGTIITGNWVTGGSGILETIGTTGDLGSTDGATILGVGMIVSSVLREASSVTMGAELSTGTHSGRGIFATGVFCTFFWHAEYDLIKRLYAPIPRISVLRFFCCFCISAVLPVSRNVAIVASSSSRYAFALRC